MDMSSLLGVLTSADAVKNVGKATKTDSAAVESVLQAALPGLLSGAKQQSQGKDNGFAEALLQHGKKDTGDLSAFLGGVDLADGAKIVNHLLGGQEQVAEISRAAGVSKKDTGNILSAAAPLLMSLLGKQTTQNAASGSAVSSVASALLKNVDVGDLLTGLLTGGSTTTTTGKKKKKKEADLLGSVLGNLLK